MGQRETPKEDRYYRHRDGRYAHASAVSSSFGGQNCLWCGAASSVRCGDAAEAREELGRVPCPFMRKGNAWADYRARRLDLV
jgi:hypothetical protein